MLRCRWHVGIIKAILKEYVHEKGFAPAGGQEARWFFENSLIGPIKSSWLFLANPGGHPFTVKQSMELPSSIAYSRRVLENFPDLLIVCTNCMWPNEHEIVQLGMQRTCLLRVDAGPGKKMRTEWAVACLNDADDQRVYEAIQQYVDLVPIAG